MSPFALQIRALLLVACAGVLLAACSCTPESTAEAGRALYTENGCANCHGTEGHGDGRLSHVLGVPPRDLRDATAFKQGSDVEAIASTIANGMMLHRPGEAVTADMQGHTLVMPKFDHLSEAERRSLALYVITLRRSPSAGAATP